eukprot:1466592-Rhodomonas_salina.1
MPLQPRWRSGARQRPTHCRSAPAVVRPAPRPRDPVHVRAPRSTEGGPRQGERAVQNSTGSDHVRVVSTSAEMPCVSTKRGTRYAEASTRIGGQ